MTMAERTRTALRRRTLLAMAVSAIGLAGAARADAADLVDLQVVDRATGQPAQVWRRGGRLFVAGQPGARYSLRVTNNSAARVMVVMSVDGVNILTGETAGYDQSGYVFRPYESYDVSGWRKSDTEVAAFTFAPLPQSYAARTGRPGDVGVIGIAAFRERVAPPVAVAPAYRSSPGRRAEPDAEVSELVVTPQPSAPPAARSAPSDTVVTAQRRDEKLGTAHGAREWSVVTSVAFERATAYPQLVRRIEYDSYDNLVAMGVIRPAWGEGRRPRPFPSNPDRGGYVPDPPGGR
jgi:hypothetical protein